MRALLREYFEIPKLSRWRHDIRTSDWVYYGFLYAGCFFTFTTVGLVTMKIIGPSEEAEKNRMNRKPPPPMPDLREAWYGKR